MNFPPIVHGIAISFFRKYARSSFLLLAALFLPFGCHPSSDNKTAATADQHSSTRPVKATDDLPAFNADTAYQHIQRQVDFGPRTPNSTAHENCRTFLVQTMKQYTPHIQEQSFEQKVYGKNMHLTNIIGSFNPEATERIILCAHWDARPYASEEEDQQKRGEPIPAANDGASGVGVLLEMARVFHARQPDIGVDIVFLDGEDLGYPTDLTFFCVGSKYFTEHFPLKTRPRLVILLDMVGDREAEFRFEENSYQSAASQFMPTLWNYGQQYGKAYFIAERSKPIYDDHIPFINVGIPAIDIIDIDLVGNDSSNPRRKYWHTLRDDMSNIGKSTLEAVGETLKHFVYTFSSH